MRVPRLLTAILAGAVALGGIVLAPSTGQAWVYYRGGYAYHGPRPYYRPPPPVYVAPRPYYYRPPPPVYVAPRPYYAPPPVYYPPPVGFGVTIR